MQTAQAWQTWGLGLSQPGGPIRSGIASITNAKKAFLNAPPSCYN